MKDRIEIVEKILSENDRIALENEQVLDSAGILGLNLMASPGAGKTSLVERTLSALKDRMKIAVIDGDIATSIDADRAEAAGATAVQINTGGECHLDAVMIQTALQELDLNDFDLLLVENVGNLICPAEFRLGTHLSVLIASIPEGDDKPYKYPGVYRGVDALVINKTDLLPHIDFDMDYFQAGVKVLSPALTAFPLSCKTGEGIESWISWVEDEVGSRKSSKA